MSKGWKYSGVSQDTAFPGTGSPAEVFMTDLIESRVPVADVQRPCRIVVEPHGASPIDLMADPADDELPFYRCHFHYNHEKMTLSPVVP